jgi:hypothetical protein
VNSRASVRKAVGIFREGFYTERRYNNGSWLQEGALDVNGRLRTIANPLLAAYIATVLMPVGEGLVLCRGADGHVEVEPSFGGSCRPPAISDKGSSSSETVARSSQEDCCGPCDDTPLGNQKITVSVRAKKKISTTVEAYCWAKTIPAITFDLDRNYSLSPPTVSADPVLSSLPTVVLLI